MSAINESATVQHDETARARHLDRIEPEPAAEISQDGFLDWDTFRVLVAKVLAEYFAAQREQGRSHSPAFGTLWDHVEGTTTGGKWMRPQLVHLSYQAFGGRDWQGCSELAAAFEMLHAALLVHDDVIDRDFVRRGTKTLGAVYRDMALSAGHGPADADHAGFSAAIIAGDLLLTGALRLAGASATGHPHGTAILAAMHEAVFAAAAGELDDLLFSLGVNHPQLQEILNMERMKTAVYSFEMPLKAGALLAGKSTASADALAGIGREIGVAYQIIDDVLGTFGEPSMTGKSVESDLREGKSTILTAFAAESEGFTSAAAALRRGDADAAFVRSSLQEAGAQEQAVALAQSLIAEALLKAGDLDLPESLIGELRSICDHVLTRRS